MTLLERGYKFLESFMLDQDVSHIVIKSHVAMAFELSKRIEESKFGKVQAIFGSGEFYRLLNFRDDGSFESVSCNEILRHKRSLLSVDMDNYNQLKNLPDVDFMVVLDDINPNAVTKRIEKIDNFRLLYSDIANIASNFPDIYPFDVGIVSRDTFETVLKDLKNYERSESIDTLPYILLRADDSYSQTRYVQAWIKGFILNVSVPLYWNNKVLSQKYAQGLKDFCTNISAESWYKFLTTKTNIWRSYYPELYKEENMKKVLYSRWKMFLKGKGIFLV